MRASLLCGLSICAIIALSGSGFPQSAESHPNIWYRAGDGCPDGGAFLERLSPRSVSAKLATAGDRIDFVVTLGAAPSGFSGKLERQTASGTVAIRRFEAKSCDEIADALALTLALSIAPEAAPDGEPAVGAPPPQPIATPAEPTTQRADSVSSDTTGAREPVRDSAPRAPADDGAGSRALGAQGLGASGIAPDWMPAVGVFVERAIAGRGLVAPAFRLTGIAGRASGDTSAGSLEVTLIAARLEGCPLQFVSGAATLRPCAGVDAGAVRAELSGENGTLASGTWLALVAHPRLAWALGGGFELEAQAGIFVPLNRLEVVLVSDSPALHETSAVGVEAAIGLAYRWP